MTAVDEAPTASEPPPAEGKSRSRQILQIGMSVVLVGAVVWYVKSNVADFSIFTQTVSLYAQALGSVSHSFGASLGSLTGCACTTLDNVRDRKLFVQLTRLAEGRLLPFVNSVLVISHNTYL